MPSVIEINKFRLGIGAEDHNADDIFSRVSGAERRLCVYGRMRPDGPDAHVLGHLGKDWRLGRFRAIRSLPMHTDEPADVASAVTFVPDDAPGATWIDCYVLTSSLLIAGWPTLDLRFDARVKRLLCDVHIDGETVTANAYFAADASRTQLLMMDASNVHNDTAVST